MPIKMAQISHKEHNVCIHAHTSRRQLGDYASKEKSGGALVAHK